MNEKSIMISLLVLQVVGMLIMILSRILLKKEGEKTKFTDETLAILLLYSEKKLRKITRKTYVLLMGLGVGLCFLFFSGAATAIIVFYTLNLNLHIIPLSCLIILSLVLVFLSLIIPRIFSEKLRTSLKRNPLSAKKVIFPEEDVIGKLKKPLIEYEGKYY